MNGAPVEYDELLKTVATPLPRTRKKAREPESLPFERVDLDKFSQMALSKEIPDANRQVFRPGQRGDRASVAPALEGDRRTRQANALEAMDDMGGFRLLASQELAASRKIEKEVAHFDLRSCRSTDLPNRLDPAP